MTLGRRTACATPLPARGAARLEQRAVRVPIEGVRLRSEAKDTLDVWQVAACSVGRGERVVPVRVVTRGGGTF